MTKDKFFDNVSNLCNNRNRLANETKSIITDIIRSEKIINFIPKTTHGEDLISAGNVRLSKEDYVKSLELNEEGSIIVTIESTYYNIRILNLDDMHPANVIDIAAHLYRINQKN